MTTLPWEINGNYLTAWFSDYELFSITPDDYEVFDGNGQTTFRLSIDDIRSATSMLIGLWPTIPSAQNHARQYAEIRTPS